MARLALQPVPRPLVEQLAAIYGRIVQCERDALGFARQAGDLLLLVPPADRARLAAQAGIPGRRSRFVYVQIAQHWPAVQHAASIRAALKLIQNHDEPIDLRDVPLPFTDTARCVNESHVGLPIGRCAERTWDDDV
jgi:hypothetical protein